MKTKAKMLTVLFTVVISSIILSAPTGKIGGETSSEKKVIATFEVSSMRISKDGMISWTAVNEHGSLPYYVEQYIYNKWVPVAKVDGIGSPVPNSYSVPVVLNSGENIFRVRQKGYDKISRFSNSISYYSKKKEVTYKVINHNQAISFSGDTYFVIYNPYGLIVKQGYGTSVDISGYSNGYYCLVYDNKLGGFEKKTVVFKNTYLAFEVKTPKIIKRLKAKKSVRNEYSRFKID